MSKSVPDEQDKHYNLNLFQSSKKIKIQNFDFFLIKLPKKLNCFPNAPGLMQ